MDAVCDTDIDIEISYMENGKSVVTLNPPLIEMWELEFSNPVSVATAVLTSLHI